MLRGFGTMPMTSGGGSFPSVDKGKGREVNAVPGPSALGRRLADEMAGVVIGGNCGSEKLVAGMAVTSSSEIPVELSSSIVSTGIGSQAFPWPSSILYSPLMPGDGVLRAHGDTSGMERPIPMIVLSDTSRSSTLEINGRGSGGPGMGPGMGGLGGDNMMSEWPARRDGRRSRSGWQP
jgi:hypothetical protein